MYQLARLTVAENKEKSALISDTRLQTLEALSGISLLPSEKIRQWKNNCASLQVAESIDTKTIELTPDPMNFSPRNECNLAPASDRLVKLDKQLTDMLSDWVQSLKTTLADTSLQLDLLSKAQRSEINAFTFSGSLSLPISKEFVAAVNEALSGLEEVKISTMDLVASLGKGTPQTLNDVKARFNELLAQHCKGKDSSKVRIIID